MPRRLISTGSPFEKTAGYSRAVVDGDFIFVSGTTGYDYTTMTMPADVTAQAQNCFRTIAGALKEGGFELADIVRIGTFLTDAADADTVMKVCGAHLGEIRPASTLVVVAALLKPEMKIEIEVDGEAPELVHRHCEPRPKAESEAIQGRQGRLDCFVTETMAPPSLRSSQ